MQLQTNSKLSSELYSESVFLVFFGPSPYQATHTGAQKIEKRGKSKEDRDRKKEECSLLIMTG